MYFGQFCYVVFHTFDFQYSDRSNFLTSGPWVQLPDRDIASFIYMMSLVGCYLLLVPALHSWMHPYTIGSTMSMLQG